MEYNKSVFYAYDGRIVVLDDRSTKKGHSFVGNFEELSKSAS